MTIDCETDSFYLAIETNKNLYDSDSDFQTQLRNVFLFIHLKLYKGKSCESFKKRKNMDLYILHTKNFEKYIEKMLSIFLCVCLFLNALCPKQIDTETWTTSMSVLIM